MNLRRWGVMGALLGLAVFTGCDENAMDEVQDDREDVIEAQQELREEEAELNQTEREARIEAMENAEAPVLDDTNIAPPLEGPIVPNTEPAPELETDESITPTLPATPAGEGGGEPSIETPPNEGNPDAGTSEPEAAVEASDTASESADESGSANEEAESEEPAPASPQ